MNESELKSKLYEAFGSNIHPSLEDITHCDCWECLEIRNDFSLSEPEELSDKLMGYHCHDLGFMTPQARLYFLRGWMNLAILQPDMPYDEAVCSILCKDDEWIENSKPSKFQLEAILCFLQFLSERLDKNTDLELMNSINIVQELIDKNETK